MARFSLMQAPALYYRGEGLPIRTRPYGGPCRRHTLCFLGSCSVWFHSLQAVPAMFRCQCNQTHCSADEAGRAQNPASNADSALWLLLRLGHGQGRVCAERVYAPGDRPRGSVRCACGLSGTPSRRNSTKRISAFVFSPSATTAPEKTWHSKRTSPPPGSG